MTTGSTCAISEWDEERVLEAIAGEFGEDVAKLLVHFTFRVLLSVK